MLFSFSQQRDAPIRGRGHWSADYSLFPLRREAILVRGRQFPTVDRETGGFEYVESSSGRAVRTIAGGKDAFDPCVGFVPSFGCPEAVDQPSAVSGGAGSFDEPEPGSLVVDVQRDSATLEPLRPQSLCCVTRNEFGLSYDLHLAALGAEEVKERSGHGLTEGPDALVLRVVHDGAVRRLDTER